MYEKIQVTLPLFCNKCGKLIRYEEEAILYKKKVYHKECFKKETLVDKLCSLRIDLETNAINSNEALIVLIDSLNEFINKEI